MIRTKGWYSLQVPSDSELMAVEPRHMAEGLIRQPPLVTRSESLVFPRLTLENHRCSDLLGICGKQLFTASHRRIVRQDSQQPRL